MAKSKDDTKRLYVTEQAAKNAVEAFLGDHFVFTNEVDAVSAEGDRFKIDAVSQCLESGRLIGWEFKRSHLFKSEFAAALRQAIHYRLARVTDSRMPSLAGKQLSAVAVFPDWLGAHDEDHINYEREAAGMRLLASHFRVGAMRWNGKQRLSFIMGESAIWHSDSGWSPNANAVLDGKRKLGSAARKDN